MDPMIYTLAGFAACFVVCWFWQRQDKEAADSTINALIGLGEHYQRQAEAAKKGQFDAEQEAAAIRAELSAIRRARLLECFGEVEHGNDADDRER